MSTAKAPAPLAPFSGFPPEAVTFFKDIARNNTKEWYDAHSEDYKRYVIGPAQSFVTEIGDKLRKLSPGVGFDIDANGKGSIKKIQTDRRFNPDRDPYKVYLEILFWEGSLKVKKENSALYFRLAPEGMIFAAGLKYFDKPVLHAYRAAVANEQRAAALDKAVRAVEKGGYKVDGGGAYKKLPAGIPADYKYAPYLLHEGVVAYREVPLGPELHTAALLDAALGHFKAMLPVHKWCVELLRDI